MIQRGPPWLRHFPFTGTLLVLSACGLGMIYSAGELNLSAPITEGLWIRQAVLLGVSIVGFLIVCRIPAWWFAWIAKPAYVLAVGILAVTLLVGTGVGAASGVKSFLSIAGFRFQPAEAAKIATILALAKLVANRNTAPRYLRDMLKPLALVGLPLVLVVLQPDLGTALAFVGIFFFVLFWAKTPWPVLLFVASPGIALILSFDVRVWSVYALLLLLGLYLYRLRLNRVESLGVALANIAAGTVAQPLWNSLASYQKNRILVFLDPGLDPRGAGWQLIQSKVALGSGGLFGKGFTAGTQKRLMFLPEQHTDFVFSIVGEEFGFLGASFVLLLFVFLFFRMIRMAETSRSPFASLFIFGTLGAWLTHVFVNVGMTIGVVPITGIPLLFISYGGSFLIMSWVAAAVITGLASEDS